MDGDLLGLLEAVGGREMHVEARVEDGTLKVVVAASPAPRGIVSQVYLDRETIAFCVEPGGRNAVLLRALEGALRGALESEAS